MSWILLSVCLAVITKACSNKQTLRTQEKCKFSLIHINNKLDLEIAFPFKVYSIPTFRLGCEGNVCEKMGNDSLQVSICYDYKRQSETWLAHSFTDLPLLIQKWVDGMIRDERKTYSTALTFERYPIKTIEMGNAFISEYGFIQNFQTKSLLNYNYVISTDQSFLSLSFTAKNDKVALNYMDAEIRFIIDHLNVKLE